MGACLIAALSIATMLYGSACGLGLTYDSRNYLAAAESLSEGLLLDQTGNAYRVQPPLFPLILYLLKANVNAALYFNLCCWTASLTLMWLMLRGVVTENRLRLVCFGCLAFSTPLFLAHQFLWSEPLFITLLLLMQWMASKYLLDHRRVWLVLLSVSGVLLCMQRNAGLFIIVGLALALSMMSNHWKRRAQISAAFLPALFAFAWWNYGTFYGASPSSGVQFFDSFGHNFYHHLEAMGLWLVAPVVPEVVLVAVGALVVLVFFMVATANEEQTSPLPKLIAIVVLVYIAGLLCINTTIAEDFERYISVILPGSFVLFFMLAQGWLRTKRLKAALLVILMMLSAYTLARCVKNVDFWHESRCKDGTVEHSAVGHAAKRNSADGGARAGGNQIFFYRQTV